MTYFIGLDLGGTNVKAGIVDHDGQPVVHLSTPTDADQGPERVIEVLVGAAEQMMANAELGAADIAGVGIGAPGVIDHQQGVVIGAPNLHAFENIPLQRELESRLGIRTYLENDANAAAMGEYWAGSGSDDSIRNMVMLTLGTGVGGGIILDGHVFRGGSGVGAELGHLIVKADGRSCGCGQKGCLEAYASATSTAARTEEALADRNGKQTSLVPGQVTAAKVFDAAKAGDELALAITDETARYLGIASVCLSRILDPDMIVFAGGMALAGDFLLNRIAEHYRNEHWQVTEPRVQFAHAKLGNQAGFIGAAAVAWDACTSCPQITPASS